MMRLRSAGAVRPAALVFVLAFKVAAVAAAPVGIVKGIVHDPQHRPVPGAAVVLTAVRADWSQNTGTDGNGEFQLAGVPVGDYTVLVSLDGFEPASQSITVVSGSTPILHIALQVAALSQSVTVTAESGNAQPGNVTPTTMVSRDDIQLTPGADRTNGLQAITAFVPGAYTTHDQLHIRGGHQISWLIDGVPVPNTNIGSNVGPQLDPKDMDYLEAMRGSYDAEYGDRTYGVFNVVPRTGFERNNEAELVLSAGSFWQTNDQFNLGGHTARFAYYGSGSGNRSDLGLETPVPAVLHDRQAGASGFATLVFNANAGNQLRLVTSVRHDTYEVPNAAAADTTADVERESDAFVNLSWIRTLASGATVTVSPFVHWNTANFDGGPHDVPISATVDRSSLYAGAQATFARSTLRNDFQAGVYGFEQRDTDVFALASSDPVANGFSSRDVPSGHQLALFAEDKFRATEWLTLTGGLRETVFDGEIDENALSPRIGATVQLPRLQWIVRGFYGRFYQAPPLATVTGPIVDFVTAANSAFIPLRGERDDERQLGVSIPLAGWSADADLFRTRATNFFDHNPVGASNVFFPLTIDGALIRGWEVTFRSPRTWHAGQIHVAYSHQRAEGIGGISGGLTDFSPAGGTFPLDHDQRTTFSAGFSVRLPRGFFAGANTYFGSGFPDSGGPAYLDGHTTTDLIAGMTAGDRWSAALNVLNVTNRHLLVDNSLTFGGTHFNNPREIYAEVRYRFHY